MLSLVPHAKPAGFLEQAKELNTDVIGVSFSVGSGCTDLYRSCRMTAVSLTWEQKLVSACICLILVVAFLDLRVLKGSPV